MKAKNKLTKTDLIITPIAIILFIILIISCFLYYNFLNQYLFLLLGWITLIIGFVLGILAYIAFKKKGEASNYESCLQTKNVVNSGIYSIVRNPMYLSPMLVILGLILISMHWLSIICGIPIIIYFYYYMIVEEQQNIRKFGNEYKQYMKIVPRLNFFTGIIRLIHRKNKEINN